MHDLITCPFCNDLKVWEGDIYNAPEEMQLVCRECAKKNKKKEYEEFRERERKIDEIRFEERHKLAKYIFTPVKEKGFWKTLLDIFPVIK